MFKQSHFKKRLFQLLSGFLMITYPSYTLSAEPVETYWSNPPETIEKMYNEYDLGSCPLFVGGFINFGYWTSPKEGEISYMERLESEKELYREVLKKINVNENDRILEVGCGLGAGSALALTEFSPKEAHGIDFAKGQIERANALHQVLVEAGKIHFQIGQAEKMPYPEGSFEKVYSVEAAQHFSSLKRFIEESYRVLKPSGQLAITTFFATTADSSQEVIPLIKTVEQGIDLMIPIDEICDFLEKAGFRNIEVKSIGAHVWSGFDRWISQTELKDSWDRNWYKAYAQNLLDYYIVTAEK